MWVIERNIDVFPRRGKIERHLDDVGAQAQVGGGARKECIDSCIREKVVGFVGAG